jgi:hypothetical protein
MRDCAFAAKATLCGAMRSRVPSPTASVKCYANEVVTVEEALTGLDGRISIAIQHFWNTRSNQISKQTLFGSKDAGNRGAATGGKQMDGFIALANQLLAIVGVENTCIHCNSRLELPGFFRPTKKWDLLIVRNGKLLVVLELKSHVGSFGNNVNNRTEEALGSALDVWTAYREGTYRDSSRPWLGYLMLLEDCDKTRTPTRSKAPHFPIRPEFVNATYARRYELLCRKLVLERQYDAAAFLMSNSIAGVSGQYLEPAEDLTLFSFFRSMLHHTLANI